ncbi:MAG: hypothetical protein AAF192_13730 [Pseudomonadota bacterium]
MSFRFPAVALCLGLLGACSLRGDITRNALDYNRAIGDIANQELLLNVLRSKDRFPRVYTRLTQVTGALSLQSTAGVSAGRNLENPLGASNTVTTSAGLTGNASFRDAPTFVLSNLDSQSFRRGITRSVPADVVVNYWRQGFPKAVLLHLFVRRIDVKRGENTCFIQNQPPWREAYEDFAHAVAWFTRDFPELAADKSEPKNFGPSIPVHVAGEGSVTGLVAARDAKLGVKSGTPGRIQLQTPGARRFVIKYPARRGEAAAASKPAGTIAVAREGVAAGATGAATRRCDIDDFVDKRARDSEFDLSVYLRSADAMVYYLGELAREQLKADGAWTPHVAVHSNAPGATAGDLIRVPLFKVVPGVDGAVTVEHRGASYALPEPDDEDVGRTYQAMSIVQEVFSLSVAAEDLPRSDVIRVAN